jgi:PAS domain S-box-containing protein
MKILHVAPDPELARVPSGAIHSIAQNVTLARAKSPTSALDWLQQNADTAVVIVEVEAQSGGPFVRELRAARLDTPVVIVSGSGRLDTAIAALNSGADGYLAAGPSLDRDLPELVAQAMDRASCRTRERAEAAAELVELRRQLARETRMCAALQQQSMQFEDALARLDKRRAEQSAAFAELLDTRRKAFDERFAEVLESRDALIAELAAAKSALEREREARSADAEAARVAQNDAQQRHAEELTAVVSRFADLESRHTAALEQHVAVCEAHGLAYAGLERRLAEAQVESQHLLEREREARAADAEAARAASHDAQQRHGDELAAAAARFSTLESQHSAALEQHAAISDTQVVARAALERRLAEVQSEHQDVLERAAADRAAAEEELAAVEAARQQSEHRANRIIAGAVAREAELISELETESAAKAVAQSHASAARMAAARGRDRSLLVVWKYRRRVRAERLERESDLRRAVAEGQRLQVTLDELQSAFHQLDELAGDHAAARFRLEAVVAERERQLADETERRLAGQEEAERVAARLRKDVDGLRRQVGETRAHAEALLDVADRVPGLEAQLEKIRQEKRRQFERAPYGLCQCSDNGTIIEANHSFVALLGYRRAEDVRDLSWLTIARERTGDLGWLLERARATRRAETVETEWTTREGRHLSVRLRALVTAGGAIDIIAEDITTIRELEGRLRQAQKMEAVGRLASEVAVTCDALLGDVVRETQEWTGRLEFADLQMPAERMIADMTRARGFLRRLESYGDEQKRALEPVSAQRVLRDLAPVLKRLVGERISLVLPKSSGLFPVDVDSERLERVLTNVAGYARERMPMGGQVTIDLSTIAIGRRFAAGHSNVRAGDHVLITVTELPVAPALQDDAPRKARPADAAGMELGILMELISSCGGHLWLEAQPAGNMVVKIHLPRLAIKQERRGRLSQWLRAASVANIVT